MTARLLEKNSPLEVIDNYLIPALNKVGDNYEKGKIFLPQLIASADCAKLCFEEVKKVCRSVRKATRERLRLRR